MQTTRTGPIDARDLDPHKDTRLLDKCGLVRVQRPGYEPFLIRRMQTLDSASFVGVQLEYMDGQPFTHATARPCKTRGALAEMMAGCDVRPAQKVETVRAWAELICPATGDEAATEELGEGHTPEDVETLVSRAARGWQVFTKPDGGHVYA